MPLPLIPLILGGIGAATAATGIGKGIKAAVDNSDANDYNRKANENINSAKDALEASRKASNIALETLGKKKLYVLDKTISNFVTTFEELKNVQLEESIGLEELNKFKLDNQSINDLKEMSEYVSSILGGTVTGALGGALAGFGAYSAAMTFGAASTGTAIGTLSGAAATNATLAFLGGGALGTSAFALGMAGGTMVLGGLVAGPALAIMGFIIGAKASENLDKAKSNYAESNKIAEELQTAFVLCNGIRRRSNMFERLLIRLDVILVPLILEMRKIISEKGKDWSNFSSDDKKQIAAAASITKAIKTVLDTPILTEDGKLTDESAQIASETKQIIEAYGN